MRGLALSIWLIATTASAATIEFAAPDRIDWTGTMWSDDYEEFGRVFARHPRATVLRLRDSPGGAAQVAGFMAKTLRPLRLDTEAEGACRSACALVFLQGERRRFVTARTYVHFHGSYRRSDASFVMRSSVYDDAEELSRRTGGRTPAALFVRALTVPRPAGGLIVFHDKAVFCSGEEWFPPWTCEPIEGGNAATLGITTP